MLAFAYYLLLLSCILVIGKGFHKALQNMSATPKQTKRFLTGYYIFIVLWLAYISALDMSGALDINARPPRLPLLVILPAFSMIAYFFTAKRFKAVIAAFPFQLTVYYQSFRVLVELLILGAFLKGMGPVHVTFEGYNFDILAGITAPIVGWLFFSRKIISTKVLLAWNIACVLLLANIVFIFITLVYDPTLWGFTETPISASLFTMPYIYIAAFYMPSAVFMHVFCINRILRENKA